VGYHTPKSTTAIASYVVSNNLGGAMIWDLSTDDFRVSLK
jgi:GH18 family chitinase